MFELKPFDYTEFLGVESGISDLTRWYGMVECKGGGSSAGGGGTAVTSLPEYVHDRHKGLLQTLGAAMAIDIDANEDALFADVITSLDGSSFDQDNNPWLNAVPYDPSTDLAQTQARFDSYDTLIQQLDHITDWLSEKETIESTLNLDGRFNWRSKFGVAKTYGQTEAKLDYEKMLQLARSLQDLDGRLGVKWEQTWDRVGDLDGLRDAMQFPAMMAQVNSILKPGEELDWTRIYANARMLSAISDLDWVELVRKAVAVADEIALSGALIDQLTHEHAGELDEELADQIGRMNGALADINATNGSAFALGQAYLRARFIKNVGKFRAELALQNHRERIDFVKNGVGQQIEIERLKSGDALAHANGESENNRAKLQAKNHGLETLTKILSVRFGLLLQAAELLSKFMIEDKTRDLGIIDSMTRVEAVRLQYLINATGQLGDFEHRKLSHLSQGTQELNSKLWNALEFNKDAAHLLPDINRVKLVAMKEYFDRDLDITVKEAEWIYDVAQHYANVLAATGGAPTTHKSGGEHGTANSSLMGGLSGAMSGASMGAMLGGAGALTGVGISTAGGGAAAGAVALGALALI